MLRKEAETKERLVVGNHLQDSKAKNITNTITN